MTARPINAISAFLLENNKNNNKINGILVETRVMSMEK